MRPYGSGNSSRVFLADRCGRTGLSPAPGAPLGSHGVLGIHGGIRRRNRRPTRRGTPLAGWTAILAIRAAFEIRSAIRTALPHVKTHAGARLRLALRRVIRLGGHALGYARRMPQSSDPDFAGQSAFHCGICAPHCRHPLQEPGIVPQAWGLLPQDWPCCRVAAHSSSARILRGKGDEVGNARRLRRRRPAAR